MKKTVFLTVLAACALLVSCKKPVNPDLPVITWASNTDFSQKELAPGLDAVVTASAPGKIQTLTIKLGLGAYGILANPYILVSANKSTGSGSPTFDLIDDTSTAAFLKTLGIQAGPSLRGKTVTEIDLEAILEALITGQPIENNTSFSMEIKLTDQAGNSVSKTAKFHFTSGPAFTWDANPAFDIVDLSAAEMSAKIKVTAYGKIDQFTITLESGAAPELVSYIKNRTSSATTVIDLVNDPKVADTFKDSFPSGSLVSGKTEVLLDFGLMYKNKYDFSPSTNVFTISVTDRNGKNGTVQAKFRK